LAPSESNIDPFLVTVDNRPRETGSDRSRLFGKETRPNFGTNPTDELRRTNRQPVSAQANLKAVQRMLGHAKASMTLESMPNSSTRI
jgi:hypothetical protein